MLVPRQHGQFCAQASGGGLRSDKRPFGAGQAAGQIKANRGRISQARGIRLDLHCQLTLPATTFTGKRQVILLESGKARVCIGKCDFGGRNPIICCAQYKGVAANLFSALAFQPRHVLQRSL
jgi:hypothetical protein